MEAMACRLSVACSRIRGNTDLIDETGGSLFDANDPEECRQAIIRVLNGEREAMGVVNQNRVQSFSHKKILATMKSVYES
jgi:glycosyltransferase involved in cell wall biosynthesis